MELNCDISNIYIRSLRLSETVIMFTLVDTCHSERSFVADRFHVCPLLVLFATQTETIPLWSK